MFAELQRCTSPASAGGSCQENPSCVIICNRAFMGGYSDLVNIPGRVMGVKYTMLCDNEWEFPR